MKHVQDNCRNESIEMNQKRLGAFILVAWCGISAAGLGPVKAQSRTDGSWRGLAESRLKAIYERGELRTNAFQGRWLPDSSGYVVRQRDPETKEAKSITFEIQSGEPRVIAPDGQDAAATEPNPLMSPDGKSHLAFRNGNLFVGDLESGQQTQLTQRSADRDIAYRDPSWSPDGTRVLFTESDAADVRMRSMMVPDDPSYPSIRKTRFARVGETIPSLRIGVVDAGGNELQWLPIEADPDGFYLGQVQWAGNSDEVLVEKLSRFRDQRVFYLATVGGETREIFRESDPAWVVGSQGKNQGLVWIRDGEAFVVISEKDGWRHAFLYSRDGTEQALQTPGEYDIIDRASSMKLAVGTTLRFARRRHAKVSVSRSTGWIRNAPANHHR